MSLVLDKRQRAMLREMGVRVWQPVVDAPTETVAAQNATEFIAVSPIKTGLASTFYAKSPVRTPPVVNRPPQTAPAAPIAVAKAHARPDTGMALWRVGQAQALYQATATNGARWLVLTDAPATALLMPSFNAFEGDAGKLLDNMLRAARLTKAGAVFLAPLVRRVAADDEAASPLAGLLDLPALIASVRPDLMLVMGRLPAQALLQSGEPFGKLRGQVHSLHGVKTIVTHDAAYLLRTPQDKAKAWDDLCLAMSVVQPPV